MRPTGPQERATATGIPVAGRVKNRADGEGGTPNSWRLPVVPRPSGGGGTAAPVYKRNGPAVAVDGGRGRDAYGSFATQPETSVPDKRGAGWPALVTRGLARAAVWALGFIDLRRRSDQTSAGCEGSGAS